MFLQERRIKRIIIKSALSVSVFELMILSPLFYTGSGDKSRDKGIITGLCGLSTVPPPSDLLVNFPNLALAFLPHFLILINNSQ